MKRQKYTFKKVSCTLIVSAILMMLFASGASAEPLGNNYDAGTLTLTNFTTGSIQTNITAIHPTYSDITTLIVKNGTLHPDDVHWIRDNLGSLKTFEVIENGHFVDDTVPTYSFYGTTGHANITNVTFETATDIEERAFYICYALEYVNISSVETVHQMAFHGCNKLKTVVSPNVTTLEYNAFYNCIALDTIDLENVTTLESSALRQCMMLDNVSMPLLTSVGNDAFHTDYSLTNVNLPNVTAIGENSFASCDALETINAPKAERIGYSAFSGCAALTDVDMPNVTFIDEEAFKESGLVDISFPALITIENKAFYNCPNLTRIDAPSVTFVDTEFVLDDDALTTVNMPSLITAGSDAFTNCGLTSITLSNLSNVSYGMFSDCYYLKSAVLPNVTSIESNGFYYCENLTSLTLGATIPTVSDEKVGERSVGTTATGDWTAFNNLPENRIVYVPEENVSSYKAYNDSEEPATDLWYGWTVSAIVEDDDNDGSNGGSSGGSSSYMYTIRKDSENVQRTETRTLLIRAGSEVNYDFSDSDSPVLGISFEPNQDKGTVAARVEVLSQRPDDVPESSGKSYQMMNINIGSTGTISSNNAEHITISFKVSKQWIKENNIDISTIRMSRYHDDKWNDLPTTQESEDDEYYYFSAETPGFSVFDVVGDSFTSTPDAEDTPADAPVSSVEEEDDSAEDDAPGTPGFTALSGVVFASFAVLMRRK